MSQALDRYREQRRIDMHAEVGRAMKELDAAGQPINISRVAAAAGVSRQWLYDSPFRTEIETLRQRPQRARVAVRPVREAASEASLRAQLDTLRERLRQARDENAQLQTELQRALGLLRERRSTRSG